MVCPPLLFAPRVMGGKRQSAREGRAGDCRHPARPIRANFSAALRNSAELPFCLIQLLIGCDQKFREILREKSEVCGRSLLAAVPADA